MKLDKKEAYRGSGYTTFHFRKTLLIRIWTIILIYFTSSSTTVEFVQSDPRGTLELFIVLSHLSLTSRSKTQDDFVFLLFRLRPSFPGEDC